MPEAATAVERLPGLQLDLVTHGTRKILLAAQVPVQPRGGDLQPVATRDRLGRVERGLHLARNADAPVHGNESVPTR